MYLGCGRQNQASKKLSTTRGIPNIHCKAHPVCFWRLGKNVTCARKVGRLKSLLRAIRFWITSCRKDDLLGDLRMPVRGKFVQNPQCGLHKAFRAYFCT